MKNFVLGFAVASLLLSLIDHWARNRSTSIEKTRFEPSDTTSRIPFAPYDTASHIQLDPGDLWATNDSVFYRDTNNKTKFCCTYSDWLKLKSDLKPLGKLN
jgi:hypothetical protein